MRRFISFSLFVCILAVFIGCADSPESNSGVKKAQVDVSTQPNGLTVEQQNVRDRLIADNKPGAIKHLYVISAYTGQVIIYSTVKGKVTSSGKRLSPMTVHDTDGVMIEFGNAGRHYTGEVLQDDGTYGTSVEYLYWWDTRGVYHQHYVTGGQIVHISDQPLAVKNIIINMELANEK